MISIACNLTKYFFVHGGFKVIEGNSAKVSPFGFHIIAQSGAKSCHHHEVPTWNSRLTSFLRFRSFRSFPTYDVLALSMMIVWNTSKLAERFPVVVNHGAYAWSMSMASMYFTTSDQRCPLILLNALSSND